MQNPIKEIYKFNKEAGLLEAGYIDHKECAYPIEEMLEGFEPETGFTISLDSPKEMSRAIMRSQGNFVGTDVDRLDKHLDAIIFNFGSVFKLGLTPQEAMKALGIVMKANMTKLSVGTDDQGKQMKPKDFIGPEEELQKILDNRGKE